ncbi:MAG: ABC transporter ATP-binding protein [Phycisphaerae bacterium]
MILRATGLVKEYALGRTRLRVLKGVDFSVEAGQFVAIVGASGSGKSTLLHILGALDVPQRGQVWFREEPLFENEPDRRLSASERPVVDAPDRLKNNARGDKKQKGMEPAAGTGETRERFRNGLRNTTFGFVFQFYHLLPEFNILENVMMPAMVGLSAQAWSAQRDVVHARAVGLLEAVGMAGRLRHRPNELSGGERQRVAIARALVNRPAVLFADEPTGNLDTRTGTEIMQQLRALQAEDQTIVMVTHDREIAGRADRMVRLVDGRAV